MSAINGISQLSLNRAQRSLQENLEALSSANRINEASDDPAGLAVSEKLTTQVRGQTQAARNIQDGISMAQTAEGALGAIEENVQRVRELSVRASNSTLTESDREAIQAEIDQRKDSIEQITDQAQFNKKKLLKGGEEQIQSGANEGETANVSLPDTQGLLGSVDVTTQDGAQTAIETADEALSTIRDQRSELGAQVNGLESNLRTTENSVVQQAANRSRIQDTNFASTSAERATFSVQIQAGIQTITQQNEQKGRMISLLQ